VDDSVVTTSQFFLGDTGKAGLINRCTPYMEPYAFITTIYMKHMKRNVEYVTLTLEVQLDLHPVQLPVEYSYRLFHGSHPMRDPM
jgi:hypothetical protein